jgi:hypothetical protein
MIHRSESIPKNPLLKNFHRKLSKDNMSTSEVLRERLAAAEREHQRLLVEIRAEEEREAAELAAKKAEEERIAAELAAKKAEEERLAEIARREEEERRRKADEEARRQIDVNMTEDSEWVPMSPWSTSKFLLPLLEAAESSKMGQSPRKNRKRRAEMEKVKLPCFYCTTNDLECLRTG